MFSPFLSEQVQLAHDGQHDAYHGGQVGLLRKALRR